MRLCVVVKSDTVYRKIRQIFSDYDILPNASHFTEMTEIVRSEEIDVAIIEFSVHWKSRAEKYLSDSSIPCIIFTGNFTELEDKVRNLKEPLETNINDEAVSTQVSQEPQHEEKQQDVQEDPRIAELELRKNQIPSFIHKSNHTSIENSENQENIKTVEVIKEVTKYVDRPVIKEVPVDRIIEREVPVERIVEVEREVTRTEIVEIKPDFDSVNLDFELPTIVPETQTIVTQINNSDSGPIIIGIMAAENEIDTSNTVFLIANSLAILGYKPLVIGDNKEEIVSLEQIVFKGEEDDREAEAFENDGVSYMRQNVDWDYSDLLAGDYTHILFWYDSIESDHGRKQYSEWVRSHIPMLICSGQMWKLDRLQMLLDQFSDSLLLRSKLILQQRQANVIKLIEKNYPNLFIEAAPYTDDPFTPAKHCIVWVKQLFNVSRKRNINIKLWFIAIAALGISALFIWAGQQI